MPFGSLTLPAIASSIVISLSFVLAMRRFQARRARPDAKRPSGSSSTRPSSEATKRLVKNLASALPDNIILPTDIEAFEKSMNTYWAKQERVVMPSCVIRPRAAEQLGTAITIIKNEYDEREKNVKDSENACTGGLFAIRGGGHSPVAHSASIEDGVLIDMCHFSDVTPSKDRSNVTIGAGARWGKVFEALDANHLAVAGGRNSAVGVGGLVLGGKPSISSHFCIRAKMRYL